MPKDEKPEPVEEQPEQPEVKPEPEPEEIKDSDSNYPVDEDHYDDLSPINHKRG